MQQVNRAFAMSLLSSPGVATFWDELGAPIELPEHFEYLYEPRVALFVLEPVAEYYGIHVAALPDRRGKRAVWAGRKAIQDTLKRASKVLARVRKNQPEACHYAVQCGMKRYSDDATHVYYEAAPCH